MSAERLHIDELAGEVRRLLLAEEEPAPERLESLIARRLQAFPLEDRLAALDALEKRLAPFSPCPAAPGMLPDAELVSRIYALILGRRVSEEDLASDELLRKLAASLNTVFDALNELVAVIQSTLLGRDVQLETIRKVIGSHVEGAGETLPLEGYLGRIKECFLTSIEAFRSAADAKMGEILRELDPEVLAKAAGGGLKFGPLRKAELFDAYTVTFGKLRKWFESGRYRDELTREFEKTCRRMHEEKGGGWR